MIKYFLAFILLALPCFAGMGIGGFPYPGPGVVANSGGSTTVLDDFLTVGPTLGSNWATTTGLGVLQVVAGTPNLVKVTTGTVSQSYWIGSDLTNNHCSQVTIQETGVGHAAAVVRASATADTSYRQLTTQVRRRVNGVDEVITGGTGTITTPVVGQVRKLCINGSTLMLYNNGALEWTGTDSTITSGYAGIRSSYSTDAVSNWVGSVAP